MKMEVYQVLLLCALILAELAWAYALWARWRRAERQCARQAAMLAMTSNHICRLVGTADALLHLGDFKNGVVHQGQDEGRRAAGRIYEDAVRPARAFLEKSYPTWLHPRRGTSYYVLLGGIRFNMSTSIRDGDEVVLYVDTETGKPSVRKASEFLDGRFQLLTDTGTLGHLGASCDEVLL